MAKWTPLALAAGCQRRSLQAPIEHALAVDGLWMEIAAGPKMLDLGPRLSNPA
jgi:hypothetical protein